ncbi:hypothetical protein Tco_0505648 [Tanacetum coccineum]
MPRDGLAIIESKSKVCYSRSRANDSRVSTNAHPSTSSPSISFELQQIAASLEDKMDIRMSRLEKAISEKQLTPATVKSSREPNSPKPTSYQPKLPYPERMKVRENDKPSAQHSRFLKMFKQLHLEIGLKDALVEIPKFNKWLSGLSRNKEKLEEIAITTVNSECSQSFEQSPESSKIQDRMFDSVCFTRYFNRTNSRSQFTKHAFVDKVECFALEDEIDEIDTFLAMEVSSNFEEASRSLGNFHASPSAIIESLPVFPIPVEENDPIQEEIKMFLRPDDLIPPSVEDDDSENEDNSILSPEEESFNVDHQDDPSIPRPPPEPPDVEKCLEPERYLLTKV